MKICLSTCLCMFYSVFILHGQDRTAPINRTWRIFASDTSMTYGQITSICDSLFGLAGFTDSLPIKTDSSIENGADEGGDLAVNARIAVNGLSVDTFGNCYFSDSYSDVIRVVRTNGIVSTIVGQGVAGFSGDWGDPLIAKLNSPQGVTIAQNGDLYIADLSNNRIRLITSQFTKVNDAMFRGPSFEVFPSPSHDLINFSICGIEETNVEAFIFRIDGHYLTALSLKKGSTTFSIPESWPPGTYIIRIVGKPGSYSQTFIKY